MEGSPWGGSEELWAAAARAALENGHRVAVAVKRWPRLADQIVDLQSLGVLIVLRPADLTRRLGRAFERFVYPLPALARWRADVVCVSMAGFYDVMLRNDVRRLIQAMGAPYVVIVQQIEDRQIPPPLSMDRTIRHGMTAYYRGAARVAFVAEENRRSAERQLATDLPNACVVRNPVKLDKLDAVPWPPPGEVRMASVARLGVYDKGQDVLFEVLGGLHWRSRPWRLRLYGDGLDRGYLEDLARRFGIGDRVEFRGRVDNIRAVWADNHILLMPSRNEGTPLSLIEAMICGRPSVVTDVGGNLEWIFEPSTGFVAEAPSHRSFGAAMERAWGSRGDWEAIGARARDLALGQIDPDPGRTVLDILSEVAQQCAHPSAAVLGREEGRSTATLPTPLGRPHPSDPPSVER